MLNSIRDFYRREPVVVTSAVVAVVVFVASLFHVVLDKGTVWQYVAAGLAILFGTVAARSKVRPVK